MTMLIKYDTFSEGVTRFYITECVLAVEVVHNPGFTHRSVQPDKPSVSKPRNLLTWPVTQSLIRDHEGSFNPAEREMDGSLHLSTTPFYDT